MTVCCIQVVFADGMCRRTVGLRRTKSSEVDGALGKSPPHSVHFLRWSILLSVEQFPGFRQGMHDDGKLSCHGDGGADGGQCANPR